VLSDDGEMIDLVAWCANDPEKWWLRIGNGWAHGETAIANAKFYWKSLKLYSTPLAWLQSGCHGGCILDERTAQLYLVGLAEIVAEDIEHGVHLRKLLAPPAPPVPRIVIPASILAGGAT
jgi:hypothetical protein